MRGVSTGPTARPHPGACLSLQLNYTRPGLPTLNPQLLEAWKNEVKEKGHVNCPNDVSWGRVGMALGLRDQAQGRPWAEHSKWPAHL